MSERVWTKGQKDAIEAKHSDLLISASAGSGKTAVLIERIIRHITDTENRCDISDMLIVTFTEAAAKQLKNKLAEALKSKINSVNSGKKHLRRQLAALPRASISTIDGFCYDLVKKNFSQLGLNANVRIADTAENTLIMKEVMNGCIEDFYDRGAELGIENFGELCYAYAELADDSINDIFLDIYETLYTRAEGLEKLYENALELEATVESDPFENKWGDAIRRRCGMYIDEVKKRYIQVEDILNYDEKIQKSYGKALYDDIAKLADIEQAYKKGYFALLDSVKGYKPIVSIGNYRGDNEEDSSYCKSARGLYKEMISALQEYVTNDRESAELFTSESARINRELYTFLSYFHEKAAAEKKRRSVISFSDCEALCLKLLCNNGEPTKTAMGYREKYKEVYIDEYQDINSIQDTIFKMVSRPDSRFLVGDIKQSIYGFRGADPSLFGHYRDSFTDYESDEKGEGKRIFLANNFRSSKNIIDFANAVSKTTFVDAESKVGYYDGDKLVCSKVNEEKDDDKPVTVAVVQQNDDKNAEAVYVCNEISKLLEEGVSPGDITILVRSMSCTPKFTLEMEKRGIPYYCSNSKKSFFDNPEIALALCWLNAIDNPRRDVYVCGILKSPIYNFTLDELTLIRNKYPCDTLFNSVKAYTDESGFEKGRYFINDIEQLRAYSRGKSASELLWLLMYEKKLMNVASKGNSDASVRLAKNNLLLLYDQAKSFENGEFKGLNNFISYLDELISADHKMPNAAAFAGSADTVKIMTVHKSKGLEFPYCFVCNTQALMNKKDLRKKILYNDKLGVASNIPDKSGLGYYNSYIMDALRLEIEEDIIESEYLILYVALTRAVNRMWVTCFAGDADKFSGKYLEERVNKLYTILNPRYIAWILPSLQYAGDSVNFECINGVEGCDHLFNVKEEKNAITVDKKRLYESMAFEYPYSKLGMIPAKMAVSKLYPDILDDNVSLDMTAILKPKVPYFEVNSNQNMGADIGNATHAFMQFCDFDNIDNNGVRAELERLKEKRFIAADIAELVDISALEAFFCSELYSLMRNSRRVYREKRFNVNLDASEFTNNHSRELSGEKILVQGVIDCFIYDDKGDIILIDYKTDRIPGHMSNKEGRVMLAERHSTQLSYYKTALERLTGDKVAKTIIYSFGLNEAIEI